MVKKDIIIIADYSQESPLSFEEICKICNISSDFIYDLMEYEIIQLQDETPEEWRFDINQLQRVKTALRLQRDLEVNLAGVAVILDLLDEMEKLRTRAELFEKHLLKDDKNTK